MKKQRSGILLVDKPEALTSADVTNKIKRTFQIDKIGHGGTLDPFATGLMVVLIGEATKIARFLLEGDKTYAAKAVLGSETDTGDHTGKTVATGEIKPLSLSDWDSAAKKFLGRSQQTPPLYSALKLKGKPLYEYAREGKEVTVKPRDIVVHDIEATAASPESFSFSVRCGGGTYIRVLAADIARSTGNLAHLRELRRLGSHDFDVKDALALDEVLQLVGSEQLPILPLRKALAHLPVVTCSDRQAEKIRNGNLAVFDEMRATIRQPGYFLLALNGSVSSPPVAVANHNPMLDPFCSIERVFDPSLVDT